MSYQYPYNNSYSNSGHSRSHRKKSEGTYLMKLSKQLAGILIIMLVLLLCKYVKNGATQNINSKIKEVINLDYTKEAKAAFLSKAPDFNNYVNNFLNKFNIKKEFKIDALPVAGKNLNNFGNKLDPKTKKQVKSDGIDIETKIGTNVKSVFGGTIESVDNNKTLGLTIVINHNNGFKTTYGHLSDTKVNEGEQITKGSVIALSGNSGDKAQASLYFEIQKNKIAVNPMDYLNK
jgi:murein DD-endopeptidase MepM/ murein hydrolase activator NlpD